MRFSTLLVSTSVLAIASGAHGAVLPSQGHFADGHGTIAKANQTVTVKQSSTTGIIDWNNFSIGKHESVTFDNGSGATLNRVTGGDLSRISGSLHATGSLYLLNSSGVIVSGTGRIVTGGSFVVSSGNIADSSFGSDDRQLRGAHAAIVNRGSIVSGGNASLVGGSVKNTGMIAASSVNMRAAHGKAVGGGTITATGNLAQGGHILLIAANGRTKVSGDLIARKADGHGGSIETSGRHLSITGRIDAGEEGTWLVDPVNLTVGAKAATTIDASLNAGTNVTLKTAAKGASGPGNQSSGAGDIVVDSALSWNTTAMLTLDAYHSVLIDAVVSLTDKGKLALLTDDGGAGGILGFTGGNVTFANTASTLMINSIAYTLVNNIAMLATDIASNPSGDFALVNPYDASADGTYTSSPIPTTFTGTFEGLGNAISNLTIDERLEGEVGLFSDIGSGGSVENLSLFNVDITANPEATAGAIAGSLDGSLQGVTTSGKISGSTDAGGIAGIGGADSAILDSSSSVFVSAHAVGSIAGGLVGTGSGTIDSSSADGRAVCGAKGDCGGLVGINNGTIKNSTASSEVSGTKKSELGGLVGLNTGAISNSSASGSVENKTPTADFYKETGFVGGLVGENTGDIETSFATGTISALENDNGNGGLVGANEATGVINMSYTVVSGNLYGGLVGENWGTISNSHATGVLICNYCGGLVGANGGMIVNSYADVQLGGEDSQNAGGLVDGNSGTISGSYAMGNVSAITAGGLVSGNSGTIVGSYASGNVNGNEQVGGLVAENEGIIESSYATGTVTGEGPIGETGQAVGGLVGEDDTYLKEGSITQSYATGNVSDSTSGASVGGLVGYRAVFGHHATGAISQSYATGAVTGGDSGQIGGLVGDNSGGPISQSYATGTVEGGSGQIGGLVGYDSGGTITQSYATGAVEGGASSDIGGFVGELSGGKISQSYATGDVSGMKNSIVGGFVGLVTNVHSTNETTINNSYATGDVSGGTKSFDGGFAGRSTFKDIAPSITRSYSTGFITADPTSYLGGFLGYVNKSVNISDDYWDTDTSGIGTEFGVGNVANATGVTGLTTLEFQSGLPPGFNSSIWDENSSINGGLPYLVALASSY